MYIVVYKKSELVNGTYCSSVYYAYKYKKHAQLKAKEIAKYYKPVEIFKKIGGYK